MTDCMTGCMKPTSASTALHADRPARKRRGEAGHVQDALQRWVNGPTTRLGEPVTTAHAQLECTPEAHLSSLTLPSTMPM
ncbi:hypothetical protein OPT61_g9337 [Boeremia exigua]|uniref:Uncharacterized protein n=1 Tax=Boeremia exigua TaxID=749465 RepID=A0ACC2HV44_9PLEO|nr:hypothetical protein OPT61_g9337 [Boeremia exigua]